MTEQAKEDTNNGNDNNDVNDIADDLGKGTNTSSTHNDKESADDGSNDTDEAKEDTNYEDYVNDIDNDYSNNDDADNDDADDDPEYTNPEEEQNLKLRAIQSVQGATKRKKKRDRTGQSAGRKLLKSASQQIPLQIFYTTTEVDSDLMKKNYLQ